MKNITLKLQQLGIVMFLFCIPLKMMSIPHTLCMVSSIILIAFEMIFSKEEGEVTNFYVTMKKYYLGIFTISLIFWIKPWPGASIIKLTGILVMICYFLIQLVTKYKNSDDNIVGRFSSMINSYHLTLSFFLLFLIFSINHWPGVIILSVLTSFFCLLLIYKYFNNSKTSVVELKINQRYLSIIIISAFALYTTLINSIPSQTQNTVLNKFNSLEINKKSNFNFGTELKKSITDSLNIIHAQKVDNLIIDQLQSIQYLKRMVLNETKNTELIKEETYDNKVVNLSINIYKVKDKFNFDIPSYIMLYKKDKKQQSEGVRLFRCLQKTNKSIGEIFSQKSLLNKNNQDLLKQEVKMNILKNQIGVIFEGDTSLKKSMSWSENKFNDVNLISFMSILQDIEMDLIRLRNKSFELLIL